VPTGEQQPTALSFQLPRDLAPGSYELTAQVKFSSGETQDDAFSIHVQPRPGDAQATDAQPAASSGDVRIAIFDPIGETAAWLKSQGLICQAVDAAADLSSYDVLVVGKAALSVAGAAPNILRVADGLKVLVFEQSASALEKRLGFRATEYGLRQVFPRVPDHPALAGIGGQQLADWRGSATLVPPRLKYELRPQHGPTVKWCDIPVSRVWRCGNRGSVASVLIEKPTRGDFLPIVDGGYSLQYSPLMEFRQGRGMVLFCQLDVTARSEADPAADILTRNLVSYVSTWKPAARREVVYAGEAAGKRHLESAGFAVHAYSGVDLTPEQILVVGPGGGAELTERRHALAAWIKAGGNLLAIGLDEQEAGKFMPLDVHMRRAEHIATYFDSASLHSPLAGVGPADVHNRDPRQFPLLESGVTIAGDGVLGHAASANVVFCQLAPWQFDEVKQSDLRRTRRRVTFLLSRLLGNLGAASSTPLLDRFRTPVATANDKNRCLDGLYLDQPEEWDDPYRFFRW
jgi:beta-galactosidase